VAKIALFYTPSAKTMKAIFEDYAGELSREKLKIMIARIKENKFAHLIFSLRYPFEVQLNRSSTSIRRSRKNP